MLVRTKGDGDKGYKAVELLQDLYEMQEGRVDLPLMVHRSNGGWQV